MTAKERDEIVAEIQKRVDTAPNEEQLLAFIKSREIVKSIANREAQDVEA